MGRQLHSSAKPLKVVIKAAKAKKASRHKKDLSGMTASAAYSGFVEQCIKLHCYIYGPVSQLLLRVYCKEANKELSPISHVQKI